jgi:DNA-binding Lrp family transcriptional regulator
MPDTDPVRLELYVRSLHAGAADSRQEAAIERMRELEERGRIDGSQVLVWGDRMPGSPAEARTDAGLFALNRAAVFAEWAERNGRRIDRFEHQQVESRILGETHRTLSVPVMTLAEYAGEDLRFVAPVTGAEGTVTVLDRLDRLAGESTSTAEVESLPRTYADPPRGLALAAREDDRTERNA